MVQVVLHRLHPGQQAIVAHPARFKVVMCGRRFGKTAMGIRLACDTAIAGKKVGWFSPTHKYALEVWRELLSRLGPIIAVKSEQDKRIELVSGGVIEIWTFDTDDPARGRKYHRVIVDEAGLVPELERVWQAAIRLTLVDYSGDALFLGTPKGRQHGFVVLFAKGQGGHPDWHSFRTSTLDNPYIPASEIEEARRDMPPAIFAQEIEGVPADDGGNPFGQTAIAAITRPTMPDADIPEHMPVVWGWDLARAQDWTVGVALDVSGNVVRLEPAQNYGVVTPLAQVVSHSMPMAVVGDARSQAYAPLSEGPVPALRFGSRCLASSLIVFGQSCQYTKSKYASPE